jgi:hypothetical protein
VSFEPIPRVVTALFRALPENYPASACSKSASKSSIASTPADKRMRLSDTPALCRASGVIPRWLDIAGRVARLSMPPKLTA